MRGWKFVIVGGASPSVCLSVSQKITHGGEFEVSFQDKSGGVKNSLTITRFN